MRKNISKNACSIEFDSYKHSDPLNACYQRGGIKVDERRLATFSMIDLSRDAQLRFILLFACNFWFIAELKRQNEQRTQKGSS